MPNEAKNIFKERNSTADFHHYKNILRISLLKPVFNSDVKISDNHFAEFLRTREPVEAGRMKILSIITFPSETLLEINGIT